MTVAIAALCENGRALILVADRRFSAGYSSVESPAGKITYIGPDCYVAFAAGRNPNAVGNTTEVIQHARMSVEKLANRTWHQVIPSIETAYQFVRNRKIEALYHKSWGGTLPDFHLHGKDRIPDSVYADVYTKMMTFDLGAELLIAGFDVDSSSYINTITNPGLATDQTILGFWAIGSGSNAAIASLFARQYSATMPLEEALYYVYEAKIQAQGATNVGDETDMHVVTKSNAAFPITEDEQQKALNPIFEEVKPRDLNGTQI
jgi:20S proteasome alpha/beta subunit